MVTAFAIAGDLSFNPEKDTLVGGVGLIGRSRLQGYSGSNMKGSIVLWWE